LGRGVVKRKELISVHWPLSIFKIKKVDLQIWL